MDNGEGVKPIASFTPFRPASKDTQNLTLILSGNRSHKILYEVARSFEIININVYSSNLLCSNDENVRIFMVGTDSPQRIGHRVKRFFFLIRFFPGAETGCEHF